MGREVTAVLDADLAIRYYPVPKYGVNRYGGRVVTALVDDSMFNVVSIVPKYSLDICGF